MTDGYDYFVGVRDFGGGGVDDGCGRCGTGRSGEVVAVESDGSAHPSAFHEAEGVLEGLGGRGEWWRRTIA